MPAFQKPGDGWQSSPAGLLIAITCSSSCTTPRLVLGGEARGLAALALCWADACCCCRFFCSLRFCVFVSAGPTADSDGSVDAEAGCWRARCFCARERRDMRAWQSVSVLSAVTENSARYPLEHPRSVFRVGPIS